MAISRLSIIKFLEWLLTITCLALHYKSMLETDRHIKLLAAGTFVGFTVILVALFAGYIMGTPVNKRLDLFFSLIGCAMFIASGVLIIQHWEDVFIKIDSDERKMAIAKGSLSIVNGIIFLIDAFLTFRE